MSVPSWVLKLQLPASYFNHLTVFAYAEEAVIPRLLLQVSTWMTVEEPS